MAKEAITECAKKNNGFDEFKIHCKLMALATLLGNLHNNDFTLTANESYGIEILLTEIANEIDPTMASEACRK